MAQLDAFSAQIVKFVREMPDDALLDLVKQKLGVLGASASHNGHGGPQVPRITVGGTGKPRVAGPAAATRERGNGAGTLAQRASRTVHQGASGPAERQGMLDSVEHIVRASSGMSASDVARLAGIPQTRAAAALKELKLAKRIFQGGDRRFARYAGDSKTAEQASTTARKNAKGPVGPSPKNSARSHKRVHSTAAAPAA